MAGGIEFSSSLIMNEMVKRGHKVTLITWDQEHPEAFFDLSPEIDWQVINLGDPWQKASHMTRVKRLLKLRRLIKSVRSDVAVAFHDNCAVLTVLAALGLSVPVIAAERSAPSRFEYGVGGTKKKVLFQLLRLATKITIFFDRYRESYPAYLRSKMVAIPNMVFPAPPLAEVKRVDDKNVILYLGRLSYEKNPSVFLRSFAALAGEYPEWSVLIGGDGAEQAALEDYVANKGLQERVTFLGKVKDVRALYEQASVLAFPSRWEGFGNALAEGMACGLACVAFAECSGASDLLQHEKSGLLADGNDNEQSFTACLKTVMDDPDLRYDFGVQAQKDISAYDQHHVYALWESLFKDTALVKK